MKSLTGFSSLWMEGNLKEIATFLEGNFAEKKEIGRKPYVRKVEALIFMTQPEGYVDADKPNYVCKLNKSIYGLKQSARCWNSTLDQHLKLSGYRKSNADGCIYIKLIKKSDGQISFVILAVYVDDIIPVSNDISMLNAEKESLCHRFEIVDKGGAM